MKKQYIGILVFLFLAIIIFFNNNFPPFKFITTSVQTIFALPRGLIYGVKTEIPGVSSSDKNLKAVNDRLVKKLVDYDRLKADNDALRGQFESSSATQYKLLPADVLGFSGRFSLPTSLIINRGERDGVKPGMAVVSGNNLVGKIEKVEGAFSKITLPLDLSFTVLAKSSENGALGIIHGQEDFILLDSVSINDHISQGETILSKGEMNDQGIGVPTDFIIGKVNVVARPENLPFQTAKVQSDLVFSKLRTIFIILGPK